MHLPDPQRNLTNLLEIIRRLLPPTLHAWILFCEELEPLFYHPAHYLHARLHPSDVECNQSVDTVSFHRPPIKSFRYRFSRQH